MNRLSRKLIASLTACGFAFLLAFASAPRAALPPTYGGVLRAAIETRLPTIDPALAVEDDEIAVVSQVFEPLLASDAQGTLSPLLIAEMPEMSVDGLTYTFNVRTDVKFHNGSVLTARDVDKSFQRLLLSRNTPYGWILNNVVGTAEFRARKAQIIKGVRVLDSQRFEIKLIKPDKKFLNYLAWPAVSILPSGARPAAPPPFGTGPFRLASVKKDGEISLDAFADYHEGRPYLAGLRFRVIRNREDALVEFKAGRLDVVDVPRAGLSKEDMKKFPPKKSPMKRLYFLDVNIGADTLKQANVRRAISEAVDRRGVVGVVLNGFGTVENNIPKGAVAKPPETASGPLVIRVQARDRALAFVADKIRYDLKRIGVAAKADAVERDDMTKYDASDAPAFILRSLPAPGDGTDAADQSLYSAMTRSPWAAMAVRLKQGSVRSSSSVAVIHLFSQRRLTALSSKVRGFEFNAFGAPLYNEVFFREAAK